MSPRIRRRLVAGLVVVLAGAPLIAAPPDHPRILERGWRLTRFPECGYQGPVPTGPNRPARDEVADAECSPGNPWGEYLYLAVTEDWLDADFDRQTTMKIERVDFEGNSGLFGYPRHYFQLSRARWISFSPPGWRGGDLLLFTLSSPSQGLSILEAIDPQRAWQWNVGHFYGGTGPGAIDPSGAFGFDLFWHSEYSYPIDSGIFRVDADGNETLFAELEHGEVRFAPGGDWGRDLFVGDLVFAADGTSVAFPVEIGEFDWAQGPGLDGDMFARIAGEDPGSIFRIKADGSVSPFALNLSGEIAGCGDALWVVNGEGCFVVERKGGRHKANGSLPLRESTAR